MNLLTIVQKENLPVTEQLANVCLTPLCYFRNGKKVELIQQGSARAAQFAAIYQKEDKLSASRKGCLILFLLPGTILGILLKLYSSYRYASPEENAFLSRCVQQNHPNEIFVDEKDIAFKNKLTELAGIFHKIGSQPEYVIEESKAPFLSLVGRDPSQIPAIDPNKPLFFSEIRFLSLFYERHHPNEVGDWETSEDRNAVLNNRKVIANIGLFHNLSYLNVTDTTAKLDLKVRTALEKIDPLIAAYKSKNPKRYSSVLAHL